MIRHLLPVTLAVAFVGTAYAVEPGANCATPASTFEVIQRGIFDRHDCNMGYCHGADRQAGLDLRPGNAYANLLRSAKEAASEADDPNEVKLVEPGRPADSLLWLALAKKTLRLPSASAPPMPKDGLPLSRDELEGIRLWIMAGAPETGVVNRVADLIDACPQPTEEDEDITQLPTCQADDPSLLLPNLAADPPGEVRVATREGHRHVEFATNVGNTGDGPLILQAGQAPAGPGHTVDAMQVILRADGSKCVHRAGTMRLSDSGDRWSYGNFADFELRRDDPLTGEVVATSSKPAFCLVDSETIRGFEDNQHQYELHCTDPIGRMGISVGYKDVYSRIVPTQWIDLDADPAAPIPPGTYYLINIADPSSHLWEKDDKRDDNANYQILRLRLADPDAPQVQPTPTPSPEPEPTRPLDPTARPTRAAHRPRPAHPAHPTHPQAPSVGRPRHPDPPARPAHPTARGPS